jgi:hypothetical protein
MPHEDETAPIQCQLFDYSLQESGKGTHLYEALSSVWGDSDKPQYISMGKLELPITVNFHAALSRLRDRSIERIIWVDAICISQANVPERNYQVQLMAKIYSKASRVIAWLGETADDSDRALEAIRVAAEKQSVSASSNETNQTIQQASQQAILALLQRLWFRRIWVREQSLDNSRRSY